MLQIKVKQAEEEEIEKMNIPDEVLKMLEKNTKGKIT